MSRAMVLKVLVMTGVFSLLSTALAAEPPRPELGKVAKAYRGPEGLSLVLVRVGPEKDGTFLISYDGIDHAWAGKVFKARRVKAGTGHDLVVVWEGSDYHTAVERDSWGWKRMQVYLPGGPDGADVGYDEERSKKVVPAELLAKYLEAQAEKPAKK